MKLDSTLMYRNGFVAYEEPLNNYTIPIGWNVLKVENLLLCTHPDTQVIYHLLGDCATLLIGEAFNPSEKVYSTKNIITEFAERARSDWTSALDYLDNLAGRFVLFVKIEDTWRILHDAIGSRSVFFHTSKPVIASHVELIAEPLSLRLADYFIPFITSRNYHFRDVKYLPGAYTPYEEIKQLTPNVLIELPTMSLKRYWPRTPAQQHCNVDLTTQYLYDHLTSLREYISHTGYHPIIGLTGGSDSRGIFAALKDLSPYIFSWVRSKTGNETKTRDTEAAKSISKKYNLEVDVWPIKSPSLNDADNEIGYAFRRSTAYYRGIDSGWLHKLMKKNLPYDNHIFVRGFGGEVLRGFYQKTNGNIKEANAIQLSNAYDVNSGSRITREAFRDFIKTTQFNQGLMGRNPNDLFYWEHRMGTWGSIAMSEADIASRSLVGYNSRALFDAFLSLDYELRETRESFFDVVKILAPKLSDIPIA